MADAATLFQKWRELGEQAGLSDVAAKGEALIAAYAAPQRRYHGLGHVAFLLDEIERRAPLLDDVVTVGFAAWYHDVVYDALARDNEERSADWARRDLAGLDCAERVAALILKTKSHHAGAASADEALFLDMDFAILGARRDVYARYAEAIREEYIMAPADRFRAGRAAFLKGVLAQSRMFRTDLYEAERGEAARDNLRWEIARLEA